jgi:hypothetical protein
MNRYIALVSILALGCAAALAQPVQTQYPRFQVISFNPVLLTQAGNPRLHAFKGWHNPATEIYDEMEGMRVGSHGIVDQRLTTYLEMDFWPVKADGFQYTEAQYLASQWHSPDGVDYAQIIRDYDLARKVDRGELDEVAINGAPYFGYWESTMAGYGGYWCNSSPRQRVASSRIFILMGWNYERVVSLHATGHRAESIMTRVYNGWDVNGNRHLWDRFGWNYGQTTISSIYGIGSAHLPPNGRDHYDYAHTGLVQSYAPDWMNNFPNFTGATALVDRETWGPGPTGNYELEFFKWWYGHMPHVAGRNQWDGYDRLNNWWEYIYNFNAHPESGGDHAAGGSPPPAVPFDRPLHQVSDNTADDWSPQINAHGRMVWAHYDYGLRRWAIMAANRDGSGLMRLGSYFRAAEQPRINDAGQVVWQAFDGRNYEIWTAWADGTGVQRITNNDANSWHADINNHGRIVWDQWDGTDYEIFSANFDGSDVVQITNRPYGGTGLRPDDNWPRINDQDRVVWFGRVGSNWEIYSANADGTGLLRLTTSALDNEFPQLSNTGQVVWHAWHSNSVAEVYTVPATGGAIQRLSTNSTLDWWPQVNDGGDVVWMRRTSGKWHVVRNGTLLTTNVQHSQHPTIDNAGRIAWQGFDGQHWQIYLWENGITRQVTDAASDSRAPQLARAGETLAWHTQSGTGPSGPTTEVFATFVGEAPVSAVGDLNCDGAVDTADIDAFVLALVDPAGYAAQYPDCDVLLADTNGDGVVDTADIDGFVALIIGG